MGQTRKKHRGSNKCIIINLGINRMGLGNQLFIYAAGVAAKMKWGHRLCMLNSSDNPHSNTDYRPMLVQGESLESNSPRVKSAIQIHKGLAKYTGWSDNNIPNHSHDYYMRGELYHLYKPIANVIPIIRDDFKRVFSTKYPNFEIDPDSAFVHVRRGDYLTFKNFHNFIPSIKYYKMGVKMLKDAGVKSIYLVSDDLEWCKKKLPGLIPFEGDELKTLCLMSMCKAGAVISASTYGAWGALLGPQENPESTIIYPKQWIHVPGNPFGWPPSWKSI